MLKETLLLFAMILVVLEATEFRKCESGKSTESVKSVSITNCVKPPCKLKRGTTVSIEERFVPVTDVQKLTTKVQATLFNVPVPFVGVDGTDACNNIYSVDNKTVGCALKAGTEYIYKNKFPILHIYPTLSLVVRWSLEQNADAIACFKVPAKIV